MTQSTAEFVHGLAAEASSVVRGVIKKNAPVALVDFPYAKNPGDCAIWHGTRLLLSQLGNEVRYCADTGRYDKRALAKLVPEGPILLQGGGNLGDLWPEHQELRLQVIRDFPDRHIIQLPQTIGFRDKRNAQEFAKTVAVHGNVKLLLRDEASLGEARDLGCDATLCPDLAFNLGPMNVTTDRPRKILVLARTDHESKGLRDAATEASQKFGNPAVEVAEWAMSRREQAEWEAWRIPHQILRRTRFGSRVNSVAERLSFKSYDPMASVPMAAAFRQLSSATMILTDRLHAHIFAVLLGIPHVVVDNNYGKLAGIYSKYTIGSPVTTWSDSIPEAFDLAGIKS